VRVLAGAGPAGVVRAAAFTSSNAEKPAPDARLVPGFSLPPTDRPSGTACGLRDPFGDSIRFNQPKS
jgi:hypothetical protein